MASPQTLSTHTQLTAIERQQLNQLEIVIEAGLKIFYEVGSALLTIRDKRLYRQTHDTFDSYCRERWSMSRIHAHRLIESAEVMANLLPMGNILPANERQARPLASLPPEEQPQAWLEAVNTAPNNKLSAEHVAAVVRARNAHTMDVMTSSESVEYYTPKVILDAVIQCLGSIALDPCSNSRTNPNVSAARYMTLENDGMSQDWIAKSVYMNPPYARHILVQWVEKLCSEYKKGNIQEAIALVPSRTDTAWWSLLRCCPVCFIKGRLMFVNSQNSAPFASAAFYLGENIDKFYYAFSGLGDIYMRVNMELLE